MAGLFPENKEELDALLKAQDKYQKYLHKNPYTSEQMIKDLEDAYGIKTKTNMQNWLTNAVEVIGHVLHDVANKWSDSEDPQDISDVADVKKLIELASEGYSLVSFPESQDYMDEEWFEEEACLADYDKFGGAAYFIPNKYIKQNN